MAYSYDNLMTKITRKVHAIVICPGYTVATDGDGARKEVVAMEKGVLCGKSFVCVYLL
jgi:hypothetical protein